jgi:predicted nucleic acid-binding protein
MRVLVSDTSVLVDLERGNLLQAAFLLPLEFAVPDVLYHRELKDFGGQQLTDLGLRIEELPPEGVELAKNFRDRKPGLSVPDAFAAALAKAHGWTLLAGDGLLRELAADEEVECRGVLWLIDLMLEAAVVEAHALRDALSLIAEHPRCRLPRREIRLRLERYAALTNR